VLSQSISPCRQRSSHVGKKLIKPSKAPIKIALLKTCTTLVGKKNKRKEEEEKEKKLL
jgi:hypothetical protein